MNRVLNAEMYELGTLRNTLVILIEKLNFLRGSL